MGVFGLTSFCDQNASAASTVVNLTEVGREAQERGGPKPILLLDGACLVHTSVSESMPGWQWILGGEFALMDAFIREWVERLTNAGFELVFILDPSIELVSIVDLATPEDDDDGTIIDPSMIDIVPEGACTKRHDRKAHE